MSCFERFVGVETLTSVLSALVQEIYHALGCALGSPELLCNLHDRKGIYIFSYEISSKDISIGQTPTCVLCGKWALHVCFSLKASTVLWQCLPAPHDINHNPYHYLWDRAAFFPRCILKKHHKLQKKLRKEVSELTTTAGKVFSYYSVQ